MRFILMVIMLLGFWLKSSAELPFKNAQEFTDYVRNLDLDKLEPIKSVEELLDPVGKEPTDPVLTKGIKLFNDGKIEDAIKYFQKVAKKWKKYSQWQRQYAQYQLFHIEKFGMLDPLYNGRPTTLDRSGGTIYGEYIQGYDWDIESDKLILSAIYPHIQSVSWKFFADPNSYYDYYKSKLKDKIDLDELHVLLKASFGNDSKEWLKNFPNGVKLEDFYTYIGKEYPKKSGPFKSVDDYVSTAKQLPKSPRIRKALELARRGDNKKAYKLLKKIGGDYADYQRWHLVHFEKTDPYYDGRPSNINRSNSSIWRINELQKKYREEIAVDMQTRMTVSVLQNETSFGFLKSFYRDKRNTKYEYVFNKDELDFFDMLIGAVFPEGGDGGIASNMLFRVNSNSEDIKKALYWTQNCMNFIPLLQRMKVDKSNSFGIGLSADELYTEAMRILPPLPELKLDKRYDWNDRNKLSDKGMTYLLRSAFWGNTKALNAFIVYNAMYINSRGKRDSGVYGILSQLNGISRTQKELVDILCEMSLLDKPELKPVLYAYKSLFDESYAYHHANYEREEQRIRREQEKFEQQRREEKARMWLGIANTLIQGAQQIANIYAQSSTMKQQAKHTKQTKQKGGSDTSLASYLEDYLEDPNHFDRDFRMLMQAADQMVRQKDWNDYCTMRAMMQQMGMDLSYEEYKMNQAKALMDLKEQGIDLVAEQRARNQEMHDFYRSQMNSGKENVERIKEQNRMKYGGGSSSTTSSSTSTTSSRSSATNSPRPSAPKTPSQTSTTPKQQNPQANNDAHQQYMSGNLNVQESSYGEKIKNVSLWIKDGANYRSASLSGELYRKEGQLFVKIGGTFFRVGSIGGAYNSYIMYGMKAYYFNR